ncbi:hypothetical protein [Ascidiimonas sp. W6]|uniref:hypothetical protein n=1 Tax=Ascidiimonas meishanensis TaxID=3128903 RepID=UPI0030EF074A
MKKIALITLMILLNFSCNQNKKEEESGVITTSKESRIEYPEKIAKIFDAHGGLKHWKSKKTLRYELVKKGENEKQTIDLVSRNDLIETSNYKIGFDGVRSWILQDSTFFGGNPRFYHNLMFYFYAMPFVLADDGIIYEPVEPLEYGGIRYPGFKISYENSIGDSPDDNYFIYYDAVSHKMQWLGYTVTFGKGATNSDIHFIRYNDWKTINGLLLPKSLTWHNNEGTIIKEAVTTRSFENIEIREERVSMDIFKKPEKGIYPVQ